MNNNTQKISNEFVKQVKSTTKHPESLEGEICIITDEGEEFWYQNKIMPIFDENNNQTGEVVVRYDITQKKIYEKTINH